MASHFTCRRHVVFTYTTKYHAERLTIFDVLMLKEEVKLKRQGVNEQFLMKDMILK